MSGTMSVPFNDPRVISEVVSFTQMEDGTAADYALLGRIETEEMQGFADRVLGWLDTMQDSSGYPISRLEHSLQAATRAERAGEDEETVVCALLHDIGDHLAPANHSEVAAAVLRPYVSEKNYSIVKHHGHDTLPLSHFTPMVRRILGEANRDTLC